MDSRGGDKRDAASGEQGTRHGERQHGLKRHVLRQHAASVSDALWPAHMRRSLATSRCAQGRRLLLLSCRRGRLLVAIFRFGTRLLLIVTSMAIGGTIVAALLWRTWYILLLPLLLLTFMTLIIAPPAVMKLVHALHPPGRQHTRHLRPLRNLALFPGVREEPETPLPEAPLVRVLETYDLSSSNVQHFVAPGSDRVTAELHLDLGRRSTATDDEEIITDTQLL